jgi:hypothetical protein
VAEPILLLTPLKASGHNLKGATTPGSWEPISGTLGELGNALDVAKDAKVDVVRSTPDPWSQARSFADAVVNPTVASGPIIDQWRGLIALFALSAYYEDYYKLTLTPVALGERTSRFAQVMNSLLPQSALAAPDGDVSHGWDRPVLVKISELDRERRPTGAGHHVALLNPACLVAGGRDAERIRIAAIPWMRNGLTDPTKLTKSNGLPPAALHMLARYTNGLDEALGALCGGKGTDDQQFLLKNLREKLQAYARDCLDPKRHPTVAGRSFDLEAGDAIAEGLPHLYHMLSVPIKAKPPQPGTSDCIIRLRDDLGERPPFKGFILLDPALGTVDEPAAHITFWGHRTLQQAIDAPVSERERLREEIAKAGYLLVTPDDLFTRVLLKLDDAEHRGRIAPHPEGLQDCLLPLSPLALLIRTPEGLAADVALNRDGKVSFTLSVAGRPHVLSRRFVEKPQGNEAHLLREVDWGLGDFALWPDFKSELWRHYCARIDYATASLNRVRGRFAMSGRLLADLLRESQTNETARAEVAGLWADAAPLDNRGDAAVLDRVHEFSGRAFSGASFRRLRSSNSGGRSSEIQVSSTPFEAAFFSIASNRDQPPLPAGMCLTITREVSNTNDAVGDVAIDFGTTNTVACLDDTTPKKLRARVIHPIQPAPNAGGAITSVELTQKFRDFLPPDERHLPTPTVIIGRPLDGPARELLDTDAQLNDALLIRHLMYFQPDFAEDGTISAVPIGEWSALLKNIRYNLKWSRSPEMRDAARRYLRQLMLMIACEWAAEGGNPARLNWHFSRPRDMGDNKAFEGQLRLALAGVVDNPPAESIRPIVYEGDAAAAYILDEKTKGSGTKGAINIILDIGGGTTDIAIWDNGAKPKRLHSSSMRLAGGDFFTGHIMANPEILEDFGLKAWATVIKQLNQESEAELKRNLHYIGELLFSGKALDNAIEREWSRISDTDNVRVLKETAYVFLGGVAWFVGRHLRNLVRDGKLAKEALNDVAVALCGRGSGLFARLHGTDPFAQTDISKIMLLIAAAAGETRPRFPQVQVSPVPKIEVAAGMIIGARDQELPGHTPVADVTAGISFGDEDPVLEAAADGEEGDATYSAMPLDIGIEDLDDFLKAFARVSGFTLTVDQNQRSKLINGVADIDREDDRDGRPRQSEFAAVLKALVGLVRSRPGDKMRPKTVWN